MRVPSIERMGPWLSGIGLFLAGMVIGSAVYMSIHQNNFSLLVKDNRELLVENDNLKKEILNLNKFKSSQSVVKKITVRFEPPADASKATIDPVVEQELKQMVQKRLEPIYVGQSLSEFTGGSDNQRRSEIQKLKEIISVRYYVKERDYKVETTAIAVIQTELIVYIQAKPFNTVDSFLFR